MTTDLAFDPPNPAGVREAVRLLQETLDREEGRSAGPSIEDLFRAEAEQRTGPVADATPVGGSQPAGWPELARRAATSRGKDYNAFVRVFTAQEADLMIGGGLKGAPVLRDIPFAFKDVYFARGHRPGAGTPHRFRPRGVEQAPVLSRLFAAGAVPVGATILDPFSYSTTGENPFCEPPVNPRDPELLVGGSSSGSSVAVGAGIVPFALGTDTGGSIRIPAAFCGVWGWKPTNRLLDATGFVPLSQSHDCPGVVARDGALLHRVADVLIDRNSPARRGAARRLRIGIANELFAASDALTGRALARFLAASGVIEPDGAAMPDLDLCNCIATVITGYEAARFLGPVHEETPEAFTGNVRQRLAIGAAMNQRENDAAQRIRARVAADFLTGAMGEYDLIVSPVTPRAFYRRKELSGGAEEVRKLTLELLAFNRWVNTLGLPSVVLPLQGAGAERMPALQIIGRPYGDLDLLQFAEGLRL